MSSSFPKLKNLLLATFAHFGLLKPSKQNFRLRDGSVSGKGLQPDFAGKKWEFREHIYEGLSFDGKGKTFNGFSR